MIATTKLFIGGLAYEAEEKDLIDLFAGQGIQVQYAGIPRDHRGYAKGIGYVMIPEKSRDAGLALAGSVLHRRPIRIEIAER